MDSQGRQGERLNGLEQATRSTQSTLQGLAHVQGIGASSFEPSALVVKMPLKR